MIPKNMKDFYPLFKAYLPRPGHFNYVVKWIYQHIIK